MRGDLLGGGVVVAVAAALWLIYLVPTWLHRREYMATERNAVRLQQTLRILAETAETPREVHVEATSHEVARQRRALKSAQRVVASEARDAAEREARVIAERQHREERERRARASAEQRVRPDTVVHTAPAASPSAPAAPHDSMRSARVRRRMRAASSLLMLASLAVVVWGVVAIMVDGAWPILVGGLAILGCAVAALRRLARPGVRQAAAAGPVTRTASELFDQADHDVPERKPLESTWTPRPLPKPLHLSRGTVAASAMASVDAAVELRRAAARAELERRADTVEPELPRLRPAAAISTVEPAEPAEPQVVSATGTDGRYATMGVVDAAGDGRLDLDAVLRRRRG